MKKSTIIWLAITAIAMPALPWVATVLPKEMSFPALILLFFTVNPVYSLGSGIFAGFEWRERWWAPLAVAALFLCGVWVFIAPLELDFLIYAAIYAVFAAVAMVFTAAIRSRLQIRRERAAEEKYGRRR